MSLTTIAQRLPALPEVLRSLLDQTRAPDRIVLWISPDPFLFDEGVTRADLPTGVQELAQQGRIEVRETPNTGSHRKVLPLLHLLEPTGERPLIVTADDDTLYPPRWLEALVAGYERNGCAVCFRARRLEDQGPTLAPYAAWRVVSDKLEVVEQRLVVTGKNGLLLHRGLLDDRVLDPDFARLSRTRCDLWLAGALMSKGTPVLKLAVDRLLPDPRGIVWEKGGAFPAPQAAPKKGPEAGSDSWQELYAYNRARNDGYVPRTFAFYDSECATVKDLEAQSLLLGDGPVVAPGLRSINHGAHELGPAPAPAPAPEDAQSLSASSLGSWSLVIAFHGRRSHLERALRSALSQERLPDEILVIDDASPEPAEPSQHPRVRVLRQPVNRGVSNARNLGARLARGRYISFLDHDDELLPSYGLRALQALGAPDGERLRVVHCGLRWRDEQGADGRDRIPPSLAAGRAYNLEEIPKGLSFLAKQTLFMERELFLELGGFDPRFDTREWTELFLRFNAYCAVQGIADVGYIRHLHEENISRVGTRRVQTFARLSERYRALFEAHPEGASRFLVAHGDRLMRTGVRGHALAVYWRAGRAHPRSCLRIGRHCMRSLFRGMSA